METLVNGVVYVLINSAMPGLVKIGKTTQGRTEVRLSELYTSGVPVPFECVFAVKVENALKVESALHKAFSTQRINPSREFFQIEPEQVIAILNLVSIEDVTPRVQQAEKNEIDAPSLEAGRRLGIRRSNFNFKSMNIPVGSILNATKGLDIAEVISDRQVRFRNQDISLTEATRQMLGVQYDVQPTSYWTYNGRKLIHIYEDLHNSIE